MNHDEESHISKLLQMRRHQQPPPEYFENFLREFQERQRAELLRRPAWRIALERLNTRWSEAYQAFFGPFNLAHLSYAGASAAVLAIAGVFTVNMLQHPGGAGSIAATGISPAGNTGANLQFEIPQNLQPPQTFRQHSAAVSFDSLSGIAPQRSFEFPTSRQGNAAFELTPEQVLALQEARRAASPSSAPTRSHPHYILDARPATYEQPVSF